MRANIKPFSPQAADFLTRNNCFDTETSNINFLRFTLGHEDGLSGLYQLLSKPLLHHGRRIVSDEFVVSSAIQEAFLKAWRFRERLTSVSHTYRFLRLNVTWMCYKYYRQPERLHHRIVYTDNIDLYTGNTCHFIADNAEDAHIATEEMLKTVYDVIPYLPANRKTILTLYFKFGLTSRQIAKRFGSSNQAIHYELRESLDHLKKIIHNKKRLDSAPVTSFNPVKSYTECLQGEMLQLFRLRYEQKHSFEKIASQLNLSQTYVQQQYVAAHRLIKEMTKAGK